MITNLNSFQRIYISHNSYYILNPINVMYLMAKNSGVIIFGIISIIALGLSGYTFVTTQILIPPETPHPSPKIVGVWNGLDRNVDNPDFNDDYDWLIEPLLNAYNDTTYINTTNSNTRIHLIKAGWYKIQIRVLLSSISGGISYYLALLKNDIQIAYLDYWHPSSTSDATYYAMQGTEYVLSDGDDYIEINVRTGPIDPVFVYTFEQEYNELVIEYFPE